MTGPLLEVRNLSKRFGAVVVADAVDLDIWPGEIHAVIGPNGAGKSSLIAQLAGELEPDAGVIRMQGHDVAMRRSPAARAALGIGRSFQVSSLFEELSVLENAALAAQPAVGTSFRFGTPALAAGPARERAEAALHEVGLDARQNDLVAGLAHGEKRQLEVALTLAGGASLLLLDEPLAGQAADESRSIVALLDRLRARYATLLVEHDMDAVFALADRITVMVDGRVLCSGTPEAVRNDRGVREAYLGDAQG
jgi:branched-chain amino acid transport system ATP-binding protein